MTYAIPSLALSGKEASDTTFYELDAPRRSVVSGLAARIARGVGGTIRSMQYARMVHALSELSDAHLAAIGLDRRDIPRHAQDCVYGPCE
jgi:uncharacterized protein YjiS (DUF1127 family)